MRINTRRRLRCVYTDITTLVALSKKRTSLKQLYGWPYNKLKYKNAASDPWWEKFCKTGPVRKKPTAQRVQKRRPNKRSKTKNNLSAPDIERDIPSGPTTRLARQRQMDKNSAYQFASKSDRKTAEKQQMVETKNDHLVQQPIVVLFRLKPQKLYRAQKQQKLARKSTRVAAKRMRYPKPTGDEHVMVRLKVGSVDCKVALHTAAKLANLYPRIQLTKLPEESLP